MVNSITLLQLHRQGVSVFTMTITSSLHQHFAFLVTYMYVYVYCDCKMATPVGKGEYYMYMSMYFTNTIAHIVVCTYMYRMQCTAYHIVKRAIKICSWITELHMRGKTSEEFRFLPLEEIESLPGQTGRVQADGRGSEGYVYHP